MFEIDFKIPNPLAKWTEEASPIWSWSKNFGDRDLNIELHKFGAVYNFIKLKLHLSYRGHSTAGPCFHIEAAGFMFQIDFTHKQSWDYETGNWYDPDIEMQKQVETSRQDD